MIENQSQREQTREWLSRFEGKLAELRLLPVEQRLEHPRLRQAQEDSLQSMIDDLRNQLAEQDSGSLSGESPPLVSPPAGQREVATIC